MSINTTLAGLSTNQALNGPDGATDLPSSLDDAIRYALAFIAQIRDGAGIPTGMVATFIGNVAPTGWVKMNGALLSRVTYANLWAYAQAQGPVSEAIWAGGKFGAFSVGDGSTTFRIPDGRGLFLRGFDDGRGTDPGRVLGDYQAPTNQAHTHVLNDPGHGHSVSDPGHTHSGGTDVQGVHNHAQQVPQNVSDNDRGIGNASSFSLDSPVTLNSDGAHAHSLTINGALTGVSVVSALSNTSVASSGGEARPANIALPLFLKF